MIRRDYNYMKSAYPDTAKRLLPFVEEECDRMEYDGSMMFDEYPDMLQLRLMCKRIYAKAEKEEQKELTEDIQDASADQEKLQGELKKIMEGAELLEEDMKGIVVDNLL